MSKKHYKVIPGISIEDLEKELEPYLNNSPFWELQGGVAVAEHQGQLLYFQAITHFSG